MSMEIKLSILVTAWVVLWVVKRIATAYLESTLGEHWRVTFSDRKPKLHTALGLHVIATIAYTIYVILAFAWGW
ncbi:hypothetical protein [Vibrio sp. TBV020]|uniref:hypothetical protein n=1 Tax=Vibrio sp. TBV020 TaxID=3137398 RepID=UPI0038CD2BBC